MSQHCLELVYEKVVQRDWLHVAAAPVISWLWVVFFLIWLQASTFVASIILSGCLKRISRCVIVSPLVLSNKCLIGVWRGKESVRVIQRKNTRREKCRNLTKYDNLDSQSVWQDILTFLNQTQRNTEGQKCWTSTYELKEWLVSRAVLMSSLCHLTFICWR